MKTFVFGVIVGVILVPLCGYFYFGSGAVPVATSAPPMPFEKMLAHKALDARISKEMPTSVPIQADDTNLVAGAQVYRHHCAMCHGLPGQPEGGFAKGMFPHPPKLTEGTGRDRRRAGRDLLEGSERNSPVPACRASNRRFLIPRCGRSA